MKKMAIFIFTLTAILAGCAHTATDLNIKAWNEEGGKSVELSLRKIKIKRGNVVLTAVVVNKYPFTILIPDNSMRYVQNGVHASIVAGNPRLVLKTGDSATLHLRFEFAAKKEKGTMLKLEHIYVGVATQIQATQTISESKEPGGLIGRVLTGKKREKSKMEAYTGIGAIEGDKLPGVEVKIPD